MRPTQPSEWLLAGALFTWCLASLLHQRRSRPLRRLRRLDALGLLPNYRFFAPYPRHLDFCLEFRTRAGDARESSWKPVVFQLTAPALRMVWNPANEAESVFATLVFFLLRRADRQGRTAAAGSDAAYRLLQVVRAAACAEPDAAGVQYRVLAGTPLAKESTPAERFRSDWAAVRP